MTNEAFTYVHMFIYTKQTTIEHKNNHKDDIMSSC
jgi:hypothetical protein